MPTDLVRSITSDPRYIELTRRRSRLAWMLTLLMLVVYYGFILLIAFSPESLAAKIGTGAMTWGFPVGMAIILIAIALTGIYVWKANSDFDPLSEELKRRFGQ